MSQTDPRAVARLVLSHLTLKLERTDGGSILSFNQDGMVSLLAQALADAERRGLERAAKMMCSYCNDPQWPRSAIVQGNAVHIGPITGSLFPCNAMQIHSALRAQAQADKEAPHGTDAE